MQNLKTAYPKLPQSRFREVWEESYSSMQNRLKHLQFEFRNNHNLYKIKGLEEEAQYDKTVFRAVTRKSYYLQ